MRALLVVLLGLLPLGARAGDRPAYLFALTEPEILDTMDHYRGQGTYDERSVLSALRVPFDCGRLGDACAELGEDGAYALMAGAWRDALARVPAERLEEDLATLFDDTAERYLAAHYPDGVPPRDPYLGGDDPGGGGGGTECPQTTFEESNTGFAVRQKSGTVNIGVAVGGFSRISFFRQKANGRWVAERADVLSERGSIFVTGSVAPQEIAREKTREDAKHLTIAFYGVALTKPYAEGCGSVGGQMALTTCTCSGPKPVEYGGS